jgi:hypothetical protein
MSRNIMAPCAKSVLAALLLWTLASCEDGGGAGDGPSVSGGAGGRAPGPERKTATFARAAVVLGSCVPDDGVNRNLATLWQAEAIPQLWGRFVAQAECLANAGSGCDAVTQCLGYAIELSMTCEQECRGSVFTYCDGEVAIQLDCAKLGLACDDAAACVDGTVMTCDDRNHVATCDAELPLTCNDGAVRRGPDCAALGLHCEDGACRGTGAACTLESPLSEYSVEYVGIACEGDVMRACVAGAEHALDCAAIAPGFSCRKADGVHFCGLAAECVPGNLPNSDQTGTLLGCEGDAITFCNAGRIDRIDCRELGFERCDPGNDDGSCGPSLVSDLLLQQR